MRFGSVCSGIEAASTAWKHLGWKAAWLAEIEPFPSAVLKHYYPDVPNYGDMTKFKEWPDEPIDLLCGGTPCQSFSVAGLRKGLDDPRGNLMLTYLAIAAKYRPKWLVWENVPGVLSSNGGRDFGSFLHGMGECGYGFAYRVLDAQYFGVAQRRRRVFVVGCLGDWRSAAAVLFERNSLQGNPAPSRETRQEVAGTIAASFFSGGAGGRPEGAAAGHFIQWPSEVDPTLDAHFGTKFGYEDQHINGGAALFVPTIPIHDKATRHAGHSQDRANADGSGNGLGIGAEGDPMYTITTGGRHAVALPIAFSGQMSNPQVDFDMTQTLGAKNPMAVCTQYGPIAGSLTARHDSSPCADRGMNVIAHTVPTLVSNGDAHSGFRDEHGIVPVAFGVGESPDVGHCLRSGASKADKHESTTYVAAPVIGWSEELTAHIDLAATLQRGGDGGRHEGVMQGMAVRRLTPTECERLQGFPDGYTNIPWRGKPESPDGPRYKALGNSWAVPCARWIGERIQLVEGIK